MKDGGLTLEELGRSIVDLAMTEDVIRRQTIALLPVGRREERELEYVPVAGAARHGPRPARFSSSSKGRL